MPDIEPLAVLAATLAAFVLGFTQQVPTRTSLAKASAVPALEVHTDADSP